MKLKQILDIACLEYLKGSVKENSLKECADERIKTYLKDIYNNKEFMDEYREIINDSNDIYIELRHYIDSRIDRNIPDWGMVPQIKKHIIQMLHAIEKNVSDNIFSYPPLYDIYDELRKIIITIEEKKDD